ncbi:hydrolase [Crenothrix sp.]|uniref:hydrolase n=1 Tax=Crenothrix sp. TaxID=3100433 RepID=UPI00374CBF66
MPLVKTTFKPAWWCRNAHLQTIYGALLRQTPAIKAIRRERLITPDHDFIDIDWVGEGNRPLIILIHGLSGSAKSCYIVGLQHALFQQGFRTVAINFRGCSGESNRTARCYHSGETEDIHFLYQTLREREPSTAIGAVGFSLGGNVLLKWLGEQGDKLTLFAAVAVSIPLVLSVCATKLDKGFSRFYCAYLLRELKNYVRKKQRHLEQIGQAGEADKIKHLGNLSNITSFWHYDDRVVAPLHGFKNVDDYYQRSSSRQFLKSITLPTLIIQSADDPFMTQAVLPDVNELSISIDLEITQRGGHVGFISGNNPFKPVYWLDQRIPDFLSAGLKDSDNHLIGQ